MRKLTKTEAVVCQRLMGSIPQSTRVLGKELGLPRRTLQTVTSRLFVRGWLQERLIPSLPRVGLPMVTFTLYHPFQERRAQLVDAWAREPAVVSSWSSSQSVFGCIVSHDRAEAERVLNYIAPPELGDQAFAVFADLNQEAIPIFFDFEAAWSRLAGLDGTLGYPQGLGALIDEASAARTELSRRRLDDVIEAVCSSFLPGASRSGSSLPRPASLGPLRRLVSEGLIQPRVFLDPLAASRSVEGFPDGIAVISAELSERSNLNDLFRALVIDGQMAPFLLARDRTNVVVGTLFSRSGGTKPTAAGLPSRTDVLSRHLQEIRIFREEFKDLLDLTNHRFDRILLERNSN